MHSFFLRELLCIVDRENSIETSEAQDASTNYYYYASVSSHSRRTVLYTSQAHQTHEREDARCSWSDLEQSRAAGELGKAARTCTSHSQRPHDDPSYARTSRIFVAVCLSYNAYFFFF